MLGRKIKQEHARKRNKAYYWARKSYEKKRVWIVAKSYIHTPKPQIQGMEPTRGRIGARALPWDCGEKRRIKGVWMCLGKKLERKEKGFAQKTGQNLLFWGKNKGFGSLNSLIQTFSFRRPLSGCWQCPATTQAPPATHTNINNSGFF